MVKLTFCEFHLNKLLKKKKTKQNKHEKNAEASPNASPLAAARLLLTKPEKPEAESW